MTARRLPIATWPRRILERLAGSVPPDALAARQDSLRWAVASLVAFAVFGHAGLVAMLALWAAHLAWDPPAPLVAMAAATAFALAGMTWFVSGVPDLAEVHLVARRTVPSMLAIGGTVALAVSAWRAPAVDPANTDPDRALARGRGIARGLVRAVPSERLAEVALARSIAIVVVVWIHALPAEFATSRLPFDRWLGDVTRFAVPVFVFVAGYLVARTPLEAGWLRARLERLLVPYAVASVLAIALRSWSDAFPPIEHPVADLLLGATFGPYYFVFALVSLAVVTPLVLRLPTRALLVATGVAVVAQVASEVLVEPLFWRVRNPLLWLAFYLGGILAWRHRDWARERAEWWPYVLVGWAMAATALVVVPDATLAREAVTLGASWLMIAMLLLAGLAVTGLARVCWWIDAATYPIYLYHLPFVIVVAGPYGSSILSLGALAGWAVGLIGAMSVIVIGRHVLGGGARVILGG